MRLTGKWLGFAGIMVVAAVQSAPPVFAQQIASSEQANESGNGPSAVTLEQQERRERRMRWLRNTGQDELVSPANAGLTAAERRQLRRDVHQAGRELYPERGRRLRPEDVEANEAYPPRNMNQGGRR